MIVDVICNVLTLIDVMLLHQLLQCDDLVYELQFPAEGCFSAHARCSSGAFPLDAHAQPYMGTNNLVKQRVIKMVGDLEMTNRSYLPPL